MANIGAYIEDISVPMQLGSEVLKRQCRVFSAAADIGALFEKKCLGLQAYLHVKLLRFQHVSAYSLRKTSGNTKDKSLPRDV